MRLSLLVKLWLLVAWRCVRGRGRVVAGGITYRRRRAQYVWLLPSTLSLLAEALLGVQALQPAL
jgi:hypothetical protein